MRKAYLAVLLAAVMALGGCAKTVDQGGGDRERMKISVAIWDVEEAFRGDPVLEAIEDKFDVTFVPVNMTWDDHYQKIKYWAATDSLPDLFAGDFRATPEYIQWIERGLLSPLPEDLSAYPHLESYMEGLKETQVTAVDGQYYCIPRQTYPAQAWTCLDRIIAYRWDLAQQAGVTKEPETWEEFQEMILAILRADPERTGVQGMVLDSPSIISGILLPYSSMTAVTDRSSFFWKKDEDGVYRPVYFADDLTGAFQLGRDMYRSGVIEKDVLLETTDSAYEKFLRGENAAILYSGGYGGVYRNMQIHWKEYHDRDFTEDVRALKLMPDQNGNKAYPVWGYAWSESYLSGKISPEKRDKILQIYDYLLSDEGAFFGTYGPEGDFYEIVDGKVHMFDENADVRDKYPSCAVFEVLVRWIPSSYDDRFVADIPPAYDRVNRELVREAEPIPIPEYEPECTEIVKEERVDFSIQVGDDFLRIMTGTEPVEKMWEDIRREYEEKGLPEMVELVNNRMKEREK